MVERNLEKEGLKLRINFLVGYLEALECILEKLDALKEDYDASLIELEKLIDKYTKVVDNVHR